MVSEDQIIIEEMTENDLSEVVKIEDQSFSDPWSCNMFKAELLNPFSNVWLARDRSGTLMGYICFWIIEDEAHILDLAVHPHFRGRGVGSLLISVSLDYWKIKGIRIVYLEVRESNVIACKLYEKFGFKIMMRRIKYYRKPIEDAFIMGLEIVR